MVTRAGRKRGKMPELESRHLKSWLEYSHARQAQLKKTLMNQALVTRFPVTDRVREALSVTLRGAQELIPEEEWLHKLAKSDAMKVAGNVMGQREEKKRTQAARTTEISRT